MYRSHKELWFPCRHKMQLKAVRSMMGRTTRDRLMCNKMSTPVIVYSAKPVERVPRPRESNSICSRRSGEEWFIDFSPISTTAVTKGIISKWARIRVRSHFRFLGACITDEEHRTPLGTIVTSLFDVLISSLSVPRT